MKCLAGGGGGASLSLFQTHITQKYWSDLSSIENIISLKYRLTANYHIACQDEVSVILNQLEGVSNCFER